MLLKTSSNTFWEWGCHLVPRTTKSLHSNLLNQLSYPLVMCRRLVYPTFRFFSRIFWRNVVKELDEIWVLKYLFQPGIPCCSLFFCPVSRTRVCCEWRKYRYGVPRCIQLLLLVICIDVCLLFHPFPGWVVHTGHGHPFNFDVLVKNFQLGFKELFMAKILELIMEDVYQ